MPPSVLDGAQVVNVAGEVLVPADPPNIAGAYLKARAAVADADYERAAVHYAVALQRDPGAVGIAEGAVQAYLAAGDAPRAAVVARTLEGVTNAAGEPSQPAEIALLIDAAATGEWQTIADGGRRAGPLLDQLTQAWALIGLGEPEAALEAFATLSAHPDLGPHARLHEALAHAALGDWARSEAVFAGSDGRPGVSMTLRTALMRAAVQTRAGQPERAVAMLEKVAEQGRPDMGLLAEAAQAGDLLPYDGPTDARSGVAEAFHTIADVLQGEDLPEGQALIYARGALALRQDHVGAALATGSLLRDLDRTDASLVAYGSVPSDHSAYPDAVIGQALALRSGERGAEGIELLRTLRMSHPGLPRAHAALGDALRVEGDLEAAAAAYDRAVDGHGGRSAAPWNLLYRRGVVRERIGDWDTARADLRAAVIAEPSEAMLLNHLGYTMVVRGESLGDALAMVRRASELEPDNGHVTDSLGWALFHLGRHEEAVVHLERAAAQEPLQQEILDHLGDALWSVGREREARFQWRRVLDLDPEPKMERTVRRKLIEGLDEEEMRLAERG